MGLRWQMSTCMWQWIPLQECWWFQHCPSKCPYSLWSDSNQSPNGYHHLKCVHKWRLRLTSSFHGEALHCLKQEEWPYRHQLWYRIWSYRSYPVFWNRQNTPGNKSCRRPDRSLFAVKEPAARSHLYFQKLFTPKSYGIGSFKPGSIRMWTVISRRN